MLNLFIVSFVTTYLAVTGFFFTCCIFSAQGKEKGIATCLKMSALFLFMIPVKLYKLYKIKKQSKCCGILRKDSVVVKQIGFRAGKPMRVSPNLFDALDGDRVVQFHHDAWKRNYHIVEGFVQAGQILWMTGHLEGLELDDAITGWTKLDKAVQTYLTSKG